MVASSPSDGHVIDGMDDKPAHAAFMSALTTEHVVLQTAASATVADAAARSSLYVFSLSSSLVAVGFASRSREVFVPFIAIVLPAIFVLGVFTVMRLVDTALENMHCMVGIARIRGYYRTLSPEAATYFAARHGRWPEGPSDPACRRRRRRLAGWRAARPRPDGAGDVAWRSARGSVDRGVRRLRAVALSHLRPRDAERTGSTEMTVEGRALWPGQTTATFTLCTGGSASNRHSQTSPPSLPIHTWPVVVPR
jgi:hypothetical protein